MFRQLISIISTFICLSLFSIPSFASPAGQWLGPFAVKPQFPLTLPVLSIQPESGSILDKDREVSSWNLAYSNIFIVVSSPPWDIGMDTEIGQLTYSYKKGVTDTLEIGADVPFLAFRSGFMDQPLRDMHLALNIPDYRDKLPFNSFLYYIRRNGRDLILPADDSAGLGDITIYGKWALIKGDPGISIKVAAQAPTGDPKKGFGNGNWDYAAALTGEKKLTDSLKLYGNIACTLPGNWSGYWEAPLSPFLHGVMALELSQGDWSFIGQLQMAGSPFPVTGIYQVDNTMISGTVGGKYAFSRHQLFNVAVSEDINFSGAPDVSFHFGLENRF